MAPAATCKASIVMLTVVAFGLQRPAVVARLCDMDLPHRRRTFQIGQRARHPPDPVGTAPGGTELLGRFTPGRVPPASRACWCLAALRDTRSVHSNSAGLNGGIAAAWQLARTASRPFRVRPQGPLLTHPRLAECAVSDPARLKERGCRANEAVAAGSCAGGGCPGRCCRLVVRSEPNPAGNWQEDRAKPMKHGVFDDDGRVSMATQARREPPVASVHPIARLFAPTRSRCRRRRAGTCSGPSTSGARPQSRWRHLASTTKCRPTTTTRTTTRSRRPTTPPRRTPACETKGPFALCDKIYFLSHKRKEAF